ncbi:hypothetical protein DFR29_104122 [Tahibacter aquaticus]|uniref:Uncharacterized protein n=1 Tax=Tahibacter aquaticus TaxID=520092 RepID=A0A4R6Z2G6_9GAMM|nr:hypothetical protein [Tahibacter aquaticus]TDR45694.1 hypothetical protein DFR29_104122 [Tahibacter aquaticus]
MNRSTATARRNLNSWTTVQNGVSLRSIVFRINGNDHLSVLFPLTYASAVYEQPEALLALLAQAPMGTWIDVPYNGSVRWVYDVETAAVEDEGRRLEGCGVTEDPNPARDVLRCLKEGDTALHLAVRLGAD